MPAQNDGSSPFEKHAGYATRVLQRAFNSGRLVDKETLDPHKVRKRLKPKSRDAYSRVYAVWLEYEKRFPGSDPRDMQTMKHFATVLALGMKAKLDKKADLPSTFSVRGVMRRFYNQWEREHHITIEDDVKLSMAPYIEGCLAEELSLPNSTKDKAYLTIPIYVKLYEHLWDQDSHEYKHEGSRVDASTLLNVHCYSSARLQEVCGTRYKDLVCLVGWKDGEPDIKLDFKREICKGLDYKKPEHPFAERFQDGKLPPLFSQPMLWWLVNLLSSGAFKDYKTIDEIFSVTPPDGDPFWMLEWDDTALNKPAFPQWTVDMGEAKNAKAWGNDVSAWAKRAGYISGLAIHAVRREILIKVNDSGASIGQVLKFASQKSSRVLGNHYLHDLTTVDGASCYLGMKPRTDLTEDFRTAKMRRNPDIGQSLPSSMRDELQQRDEYVLITKEIEKLKHQIKNTVDEDELCKLNAARTTAYRHRSVLEKEELKKYWENAKRVHPAQRGQQHQGDGQHRKKDETEFDRIRHMMPERDRLSRTLFLRVSIRSPEGRSAMQDLINLRTQDSQVAYQEVLKPNKGCCPVGSCGRQMKDIPIAKRWDHVFRCQQNELMKEHSYAKFCFIPTCSTWITSETAWHAHCQDHIDKNDLPFKCDPVKFRRAVACAGYCPFHLGDIKATAAERMQSFPDRSAWQRHISCCSSRYFKRQKPGTFIPCPLSCQGKFPSQKDLWHHLEDVHNTPEPPAGKKRKSCADEIQDEDQAQVHPIKRRREPSSADERNESGNTKFIHISALDLDARPSYPDDPTVHMDSSGYSTPTSWLFDVDTEISREIKSSVSASPPQADNAHASESCSGNSTPLSEMFDFDMASSSMASSGVSPPSSDVSTFGAPHDWLPRESSLPDFAHFAIDPALQSQTSAVGATTNTDTESHEDKSAPVPNIEPIGVDSHDAIGLLSGSTELPSEDKQDTAVAPKKIPRIVIKVPGSRTPSAKHCPDASEEATHVSSGDNDVYTVDCLLDKWSNWFFVRWFDGSCTWEPRENIRDNELIRKLNKEHGGLKWGVEVLQARRESRGVRYLVRWKGGKWKDQWVAERYMCRELIEEHRPEKKVKRRRKN